MLTKFKQQKLLAGPLANQVKKLKADFDKWAETEELHDGMGEEGPDLLRAVSEAYECGRQVLNLLMSFSNLRQALTPATKIFANMEKPAVQDFIQEAQCARALNALDGYLPAEYLEIELKILACMALKGGEPAEVINSVSKSVLAQRFSEGAALQVQRSVQCSASGVGARGFVFGLSCGCRAMWRVAGSYAMRSFICGCWTKRRFGLVCGCWAIWPPVAANGDPNRAELQLRCCPRSLWRSCLPARSRCRQPC